MVLDKEGNGSVMDPRGKCVLLLQEAGTARVLDRAGNLVGAERRGAEAGADEEGAKVYKWAFDGLHVEFKPSSWELCVRLQNDRVACEFSSLTGGRLVKDKDRGVGVGVGVGVLGTGARGRGEGARVPDLDGMHDEMRQGIASVTSGLDSMMAGLKIKDQQRALAQGDKSKGRTGARKDKSKK